MSKGNFTAKDISAIGITNQRESTVVWNKKTGKPYHNLIVWNDIRTADICNRIEANGGKDQYRKKTGLPIASYFSLSKLLYLFEKIPNLRKDAESGEALFGTVDSYLLWKLSGGKAHMTEVSNASRTLMMDLKTLDWDDEILKEHDIPRQMLPSIQPSAGEFCSTNSIPEIDGVPVTAILGDQQAALFGQTCFQPGEAKCTYGTGAFLMMNTANKIIPSTHGMLTTVAYKIGDEKCVYALEGTVMYCGSLIQWLRDNLQFIKSNAESEQVALSVEDNGGVSFVPAFAGLGAPHWDLTARGMIMGLTGYNTKAHIVRAALEAAPFQVKQVLDCIQKDSDIEFSSLKVDGGMTLNNMVMQFQADLLKIPTYRPVIPETTALGVAFAAGLSTGVFESREKIKEVWKCHSTWTPDIKNYGSEYAAQSYKKWQMAVERCREWDDQE